MPTRFRSMKVSLALVPLVLALLVAPLLAQPREENQRYRLAQGYEEAGDLKSASRVYLELYQADPQSNIYFAGLRRTYMSMLRFKELLPIVEERADRFSRDVELNALHANLLHRNNQRDEAAQKWDQALESSPEDPQTYSVVAESQIELRLYDLAVASYERGRQRLGDITAFADQLGQLYGVMGKFEHATIEYLKVLDHGETGKGFVMAGLGLFTTNPAGADAAIKITREAVASRPDHLPYLELLSWLYNEKGDYVGSFQVAQQLDRIRGGKGTEIFRFADRALREEHYDVAITALEYFQGTFQKENPLYSVVLLSYARALEGRYRLLPTKSRKELEDLIERYGVIIRENKGTPSAAQALLRVARLQSEELDESEDAIETLLQIRNEYPTFRSIHEAALLQGDIHLRRGEIERARSLYAATAESTISGDEGNRYRDLSSLRLAEILFFQGEFKDAADAFLGLTNNPASDAANDALGYLFLIQENMEKNEARLKLYANGKFLLLQRKWEESIAEMDRVVVAGGEGGLAENALLAKAQAQEGTGEVSNAVATLLVLHSSLPDGVLADRALFHAAELSEAKLGDRAKSLELYTRLLTDYPTSSFVERARLRIRSLRGES